ncbi:MAG: 2-C-methyl-D-erythritol 4-phosphate cytidylyltransferase [Verrucomicrobia bacterium]|nr:2-C-methyl-D-erythritol 4-phosphate cytidylyltransferase [Verrucomicrobiota bacterium]
MIAAIVLAGGSSRRMGKEVDKLFLKLGDAPLIAHTLTRFQNCRAIKRVFLVVRGDGRAQGEYQRVIRDYRISKVQHIISGGPERRDSVWNGLRALPAGVEIIVIHDGARPCVPELLIEHTIESARKFGSGIAACKVADTIKEVDDQGRITATVPREMMWAAQTPQTFKYDLIMRAYREAIAQGAPITDDAAALELIGEPVHVVESVSTNIKVTTPMDVEIAKVLLPAKMTVNPAGVPPGTFYFGTAIERQFR